jgi:formate C-acetyltransferase
MIDHATRVKLLRSQLADPIEPEWDEPFHNAWMAAEGDPEVLRLAKAQAAELAAACPVIKAGEIIIGNNALRPVVTAFSTAFAHCICVDHERLRELREARPDECERLDEIEAYWTRWFADTGYQPPMLLHASLAYELFLDRGIDGMRDHVRHWRGVNVADRPETDAWYEALLIVLDGVSAFILQHARCARREAAAEADPERREELSRVAAVCERISAAAPASFHEAIQLLYFIFWLCGHDSPGPIDRYLFPALRRDLDAGAITLDDAQELVDCLWLKFEEKTAYGATIAGQLADGSDACNEMTVLCLSAIRRLRLLSPRTAFRWHAGVDPDVFTEACRSLADGVTYPALVNDAAMLPSLIERGIAPAHAAEYSFVGCGQTYPHGRGHGSYEDVVINSVKPLELALNGGVDPMTGAIAGPSTGQAEAFETWEQFETAYRLQMDEHISAQIEAVNAHRRANATRWVSLLRSLLTYSCVERGLDWNQGGADYSEGMVDMVGLTTVTDSLVAIRRAVFEERKVSLGELRDTLNADWEGREELRRYLLTRMPKFGNGDPEADGLMVAEFSRINDHIRSYRTVFGGPWGMDVIGWSDAVEKGRHTGATPDGRRRGEALADCAGPAQGRNVCGLTATLNSMMKLPHDRVHGPLALSLRFGGRDMASPEGVAKLQAMIETYFLGGGQQLQISVAGTQEMQAAQRDPDAHRSLMVRVGGFSAYFTQLDRAFQDDMIARSELSV